MGLDDIKKSILDEAKQQAEKIEKENQQQIAELQKKLQQKLEDKKSGLISIGQRKADQKLQQTNFKLEAKLKTKVMTEKQSLIYKAYDKVLEKLTEMDDESYIELMVKLIEQLPDIKGELISVQEKENLLKKALRKSKRKYNIAKEEINGKGGFKFVSGTIDIDNTFSALINNTKEQTSLEVSQVLFGDE